MKVQMGIIALTLQISTFLLLNVESGTIFESSIRERRIIEAMVIDSIVEENNYLNEQWQNAIWSIFLNPNLRYMPVYSRLIFLYPLYCKKIGKEWESVTMCKFFLRLTMSSIVVISITSCITWENAYIVFWIAVCTFVIGVIGTILCGGGKKLMEYLEKINF